MDEGKVSSDALLAGILSKADAGGLDAIARLLDSAAFSVAVFDRVAGQPMIAYLNSSAAAQGAVAADEAVGRPVAEAFPQINTAFISELMARAVPPGTPMKLRGLMPGGSAWSIDAVPLGLDRLLVLGEELGDAVSSRQRLEALVASMEAILRPTEPSAMAAEIVEQARQLFVEMDVALGEVGAHDPYAVRIIAGTAEWASADGTSLADDTVVGRAAAQGEAVELSLPLAQVATAGDREAAARHAVRIVPLTAGGGLADGRASLGILIFVKRGSVPLTNAERTMMDEFSKLASLATHRAELLLDARNSAHRLRLTLDLAMAFASSDSPRAVIQLLLSRTLDAVDADRATLSRIDAAEITIEATYARSGELTWMGRRYGLDWIDSQPLVKRAIESRAPIVGGGLDAQAAAPEFRAALSEVRQTATLPLMLGRDVAGLLVVSRAADRPFQTSDVSVLELMGNAAMLALRNARLVEDLQVANAAKSEFLNLAAHELRTPVTVISGYTSMLQAGSLNDPADADKALRVIEDKAAELARLVDSLLATARLQNAAATVVPGEFDLAAAAMKAVERADAFASLAAGSVRPFAPAAELKAIGDPELVGRILDNLLNNAIAYSTGPPRVNVTTREHEGHADVDVEDSGRGIPASHHAAVFDEFVRVDDGVPGSPSGAGLGLFIARRLARSIGGEVTLVRSSPGEGSIFRLRLEGAGRRDAR